MLNSRKRSSEAPLGESSFGTTTHLRANHSMPPSLFFAGAFGRLCGGPWRGSAHGQPRKGSRCRSRSRFLLCSKFFRVRHGMHRGKALHPNARLLRLNQDIKSTPSPLQRSVPECSSLSPNLLGNVAGNVDKQI